jgi:hypothetical protein
MSRKYLEIPLTPKPQSFSIFLGKVQWYITLRWNHILEHWTLDFRDSKQVMKLGGLPVTTGVDMLAQFQYLGFGGALMAQSSNDPLAPPTFHNLGVTAHLIFIYDQEDLL